MRKKQFKAESKKLLDMMINSIYTHKEIFLRELISNASDAMDKLYFKSLTDDSVKLAKDDFKIQIDVDKDSRTITLTDNGIGMTADELESNLGTIAKSGSLNFKQENADDEKADDISVIGQFGVGFYSSFMVADKVEVVSKAFGSDTANKWVSSGVDGYTIEECSKEDAGTVITLYIKEDNENEKYSDYLEEYKISELVKKYSDYIRYPICMEMSHQVPDPEKEGEYITEITNDTLNSMVPLWRKSKSEIEENEYNEFYKNKFFDYNNPLSVIHSKTEGQATFDALMFIPENPPYDFYSKEYEKGLQLYSNGVLIMEKCADLLPDYFSFVKGLVDSADLSLNISREMLQHDHQLKIIAKAIDKKLKNELKKMLNNDREKYEKFFKAFGVQLKFGVYANYGMEKDALKDLLLFASSNDDGLTTLKEYVGRMADSQDTIYYACGENTQKIAMIPQMDAVKEKGYEVLYFTDEVDEFAIQMLMEYEGKHFANICKEDLDLSTEAEKEAIDKKNEDSKELLDKMKDALGNKVSSVKLSNKLGSHPVSLSSEGYVSLEMEKVLNAMPGANQGVKAQLVLEINSNHKVFEKLASADDDALAKYTKLLYSSARLIAGLDIENPTEFSDVIADLM
ncbi:MAG: molecular chaperone HtpG [Acetobacter sp.]|nr:molecular chaperone HtpG [Bacteroides sp.]MCM1341120.1 molecular chaperone HtpG [Acetobacter sp.]MCM1433546.1 molecular chaperone HtpG [Clostridiales bacterium]